LRDLVSDGIAPSQSLQNRRKTTLRERNPSLPRSPPNRPSVTLSRGGPTP
jgi:hypothetical protein